MCLTCRPGCSAYATARNGRGPTALHQNAPPAGAARDGGDRCPRLWLSANTRCENRIIRDRLRLCNRARIRAALHSLQSHPQSYPSRQEPPPPPHGTTPIMTVSQALLRANVPTQSF